MQAAKKAAYEQRTRCGLGYDAFSCIYGAAL